MVILFHAQLPVPGGFVGVDIFFVISGFVITEMLSREWASTGQFDLKRFYLRRFKRLTPALALTAAATMLLAALFLSPIGPQQTTAKTALGSLVLVANVVIARTTGGYFDQPADSNALLNTWSLSVEEQFYLVFPMMLGLAWYLAMRRPRFKHAPLVVVGTTILVSFIAANMATTLGVGPHTDWVVGFYGAGSRAWEFAVGALLALGSPAVQVLASRRALIQVAAMAGVSLIILSGWLITEATPFPSAWTLLPVLGTALLLIAGMSPNNPASRALSTRPLVTVGDWSYSLYLWHWPLIAIAIALWPERPVYLPLAALVAFVPATLSYYFVETPLRRASLAGRRQVVTLVAATTLPPALLAVGLWTLATNGYWSANLARFQASVTPEHAGVLGGCDKSVPMGPAVPPNCHWGLGLPGDPIYLVGDSNADHFSEAVIGAGEALGRPVTISTSQGCPFVGAELQFDPLRAERCAQYYSRSVDNLTGLAPGLVIISMANHWWPADDKLGAGNLRLNSEDARAAAAIAASLTSATHRLQDAGHTVLLIQTIPEWRLQYRFDPARCNAWSLANNSCSQTMPRAWGLGQQGIQRTAIAETSARTGASVLDTWDTLCPADRCNTQGEGFVRYHDRAHITVDQSKALIPVFTDAIAHASRQS